MEKPCNRNGSWNWWSSWYNRCAINWWTRDTVNNANIPYWWCGWGADITQGLPRIKELLDVTTPKGSIAVISEIDGKISDIRDEGGIHTIYVKSDSDERKYKTQYNAVLRIKIGDKVVRGQKLTEGSIKIKELLEVAKIEDVHNYILKEVQRVYRLQGIEISDKYIEIIIKQMLNKVKIIDAGDTELLPGKL